MEIEIREVEDVQTTCDAESAPWQEEKIQCR